MDSDLLRLQRTPQEVARWKLAQQHVLAGRGLAAMGIYKELRERYPGVAQLAFEQAIAAAGELEFSLAEEAFDRAAEMSANDPAMLVLIGQHCHRLGWFDRARDCFQRAAAADRTSVHGCLSLAAWLERERRLEAAWETVEACATVHPRDPQVLYFRGFLLHRMGRNDEAEPLLRELVKSELREPNLDYSSRNLLAMVLDELGEYAEAFHWLLEAKAGLRKAVDHAGLEKAYDRADRQRRELLAGLTLESVRRWRTEEPAAGKPCRLAFLGGHPRSGTTLIEQILGAHPGVRGFDEPDAFTLEIGNRLAPMQAERKLTAEALEAVPARARSEMGKRYLKRLLRNEGAGAELLLDKNPSPTTQLHLWLRVFPEMKVIIALRDPRDVLVSTFFQTLNGLTATNVNFLTLERTARHYRDLMDVWLRMRELGGFDWTETRYEDVVSDVEGEGKRVTEFAGLTWHPEQANYRESAGRKILQAPTYHDVTKPVYRRAIGRWERYAEMLKPVLPELAPYCKAFRYSE
jgi:Flp pilus assembly protein TadD